MQRGDPTPERRPPTRGDSAPREGRRCKRSEGRLRTPPWRWLGGPSSLWKTLRSNALQALGFGRSARGGGKGQVTLMAAVLQIMAIRAPEARIRNAKAALITALAAFASGASFAGSSLTLISRFQAQSLAASLPLGAASCLFTLVS